MSKQGHIQRCQGQDLNTCLGRYVDPQCRSNTWAQKRENNTTKNFSLQCHSLNTDRNGPKACYLEFYLLDCSAVIKNDYWETTWQYEKTFLAMPNRTSDDNCEKFLLCEQGLWENENVCWRWGIMVSFYLNIFIKTSLYLKYVSN